MGLQALIEYPEQYMTDILGNNDLDLVFHFRDNNWPCDRDYNESTSIGNLYTFAIMDYL